MEVFFDTEKTVLPRPFIARVNRLLSILAVALGIYVITFPLVPYAHFYLFLGETGKVEPISLSPRIAQAVNPEAGVDLVPQQNQLIIPSIGVDGKVHEGESVEILSKGIWHRPNSSTPDAGGNTVFVAHRYLYTSGPNTFYLLDKVNIGEEITVWWDNRKYTYVVAEIKTVLPAEVSIEAPTQDPRLTLYTCAPLFSASKRLVVVAYPKSKE